jgi:hypothetical protein
MLIAETQIETDRPGRYLVQICRHFSNKGRHLRHRRPSHAAGDVTGQASPVSAQAEVTWSETAGTVVLPWGRCTLAAEPGVLTVRVEAVDEESLGRFRNLIGTHLDRFSRRDPLQVRWHHPAA